MCGMLTVCLSGFFMPPSSASVVNYDIIEIRSIDCAEAHSFTVLGGEPIENDDQDTRVSIGVPKKIGSKEFSWAEFLYMTDESFLEMSVSSSQPKYGRIILGDVRATYRVLKNGRLDVFYDRDIYRFIYPELVQSIENRGFDSRNRRIERDQAYIDSTESCGK